MLLLGVHSQLAALANAPELELTPTQAKVLAKAATDVAAFYPGVGLDPKTAAWFNLAQVALVIYAPKVFQVRARRRVRMKPGVVTSPGHTKADANAPDPIRVGDAILSEADLDAINAGSPTN